MSTVQKIQTPEGRIAIEIQGDGPVVLAVPGMGDIRQTYRHLADRLVAEGYQFISMDVRKVGDSDITFDKVTPEAVGADVVAVLEALDIRDATLVGNSFSAASVIWAAAEAPDRVARLVTIGGFVRDLPMNPLLGLLLWALFAGPWGRWVWMKYYDTLLKAGKPADHAEHLARLGANLAEKGRFDSFRQLASASKAPSEARIPEVKAKALVLMGSADPDFPDAEAEAKRTAEVLHGRYAMLEGAGHYPHQEIPEVTAGHILSFLKEENGWRASA